MRKFPERILDMYLVLNKLELLMQETLETEFGTTSHSV